MLAQSPEARPNPYLVMVEITFEVLHGVRVSFSVGDTEHTKLG